MTKMFKCFKLYLIEFTGFLLNTWLEIVAFLKIQHHKGYEKFQVNAPFEDYIHRIFGACIMDFLNWEGCKISIILQYFCYLNVILALRIIIGNVLFTILYIKVTFSKGCFIFLPSVLSIYPNLQFLTNMRTLWKVVNCYLSGNLHWVVWNK